MGYKKVSKIRSIILLLIIVGSVELAIFGFWSSRNSFTREPIIFRNESSQFVQYENFTPQINNVEKLESISTNNERNNYNYEYEATRNNIGELYGYEPLYMTLNNPAGRCGVNAGCALVSSGNAFITRWSPNSIDLKRSGAGLIILNIAPSSYWEVNGVRDSKVKNVTGPNQLMIADPSEYISLKISPSLLSNKK